MNTLYMYTIIKVDAHKFITKNLFFYAPMPSGQLNYTILAEFVGLSQVATPLLIYNNIITATVLVKLSKHSGNIPEIK